MRRLCIIAAVALQVFVLAWMGAERELILRTGKMVRLRTAPVDPTDAMRGEYVRLDYAIAHVPRSLCRDALARPDKPPEQFTRDTKVYAALRVEEDGVAELISLSDRPPADALFLRGRTEPSWGNEVRVHYGLEAFFMQQGRAAAVENERWQEFRGVPLIVEAAVGRNGVGVLRSFRWDSLGLTLLFDNTNGPAQPPAPGRFMPARAPITAIRAVLRNHGTNELAILDLPGGRSFALVPDVVFGGAFWHWVGESNAPPVPRPEDVVVLKPGEAHTNRIDVLDPAWFVVNTAVRPRDERKPCSIASLTGEWSLSFRLEYRPPDRETCRNLPAADLIWHGRLPSLRIWPRGGMD